MATELQRTINAFHFMNKKQNHFQQIWNQTANGWTAIKSTAHTNYQKKGTAHIYSSVDVKNKKADHIATHCRPRRIHAQSITSPHPGTQSNNSEHFSSLQCMYRYIYIIYNVCTGIYAASNSTQEILSPWSLHGASLLDTLGPTGRHDQTEDRGFCLKCTTDFHA